MHPNSSFDWDDPQAMLAFASQRAFAHIFTASSSGLSVIHAPVLITGQGLVQFHFSRRNRAADRLPGAAVLISITGRDAYQSANWYVSENQVPTWHYEAVEIEGVARAMDPEELVDHLDALSSTMENRWSPQSPWTRSKMAPGKFDAMTKAIMGLEVTPVEIRGTRKFNQHKSLQDLDATIGGQREAGRDDIVAAIQTLTGRP